MKRCVISVAVSLAALAFAAPAAADERPIRFEGGIGSQPFARVNNVIAANDVLEVQPGGRPWVIARLTATIRSDGRISVDGRGLLLAGGNNVGRNGNQSVHARLFCDGVAFNTTTVPLDAEGDFSIDDEFVKFPSVCGTPILLIVSGVAPGGNWFAAGIPKR